MFGPGRPWAFLCVCLGRHTRSSCVVFELACTGAAKSDPQAVEIYRNIMFARTYVPDLCTSVDYIPSIGHSRTSDAALSIHLHFNFDLDMKTIYHLIYNWLFCNVHFIKLVYSAATTHDLLLSESDFYEYVGLINFVINVYYNTEDSHHAESREASSKDCKRSRTSNKHTVINQGFRSKTAIDKDNATAKGSGGEGGEKS